MENEDPDLNTILKTINDETLAVKDAVENTRNLIKNLIKNLIRSLEDTDVKSVSNPLGTCHMYHVLLLVQTSHPGNKLS